MVVTSKMKWGNQLLEKYDACAICGSKKNLEPHHIIQTNNYDEFHTSITNGLVLCHKCHHEYHQKYHDDINFKTLLEFKGQYEKNQHKSYRKKYQQEKKAYKRLKDRHDECVARKEIIKEKLQHYQEIALKYRMPSSTKLEEYIDKLITENNALKDAQDGLVSTIAHFDMEDEL